ncbi:MAG: hypothetical protein K2H65_03900, partial [Bacteroidales bacterium]|nr:hypothetical protein [Bacteroidales bacterium]
MARVGQMYSDGHVWWSASKEVTFEVNFAIEISPLLGGDTFGKNVALGVSVNIGETNPIGMPIYADNKYPTAVYYTTDGTTEPSKAAYDAQADKVNGAIKKLENTMEDGWAVMDGNGNTISLPLFDKDIHLKAKAYVTKGEETLETALFDKALKVKAGANPVINPVSGTVVKVGDKIVIKNPAPLPDDNDDEYGGFGGDGDGDGDLSEAALGTLYFSFDGTLPTLANAETQQYDDENEADPYHAWSVWTAEGKDVEITIQEDEKGLYAYVPAIGESIYTLQKDTVRLEGGMLSVQVMCITEMEAGRDPRTGMPTTFKCGSDFMTAAYTDGSVALTFNPASGSEVEENT